MKNCLPEVLCFQQRYKTIQLQIPICTLQHFTIDFEIQCHNRIDKGTWGNIREGYFFLCYHQLMSKLYKVSYKHVYRHIVLNYESWETVLLVIRFDNDNLIPSFAFKLHPIYCTVFNDGQTDSYGSLRVSIGK